MTGPQVMGYIYLDYDDVLEIHTFQLEKFGGTSGI